MRRKKKESKGTSALFPSKKSWNGKEEARKSMRFLFLAFLSLFILFIASSIVPLEWTELFVANSVLNALNAGGIEGKVIAGEPVQIILEEGPDIEISYLCTGLLEIFVLASVIIASAGIPIRERIIGVVVGTAASVFVNFLRILGTVYFIYNSDLETADFIHNIFFRATLFITIFAFYALWFRWATSPGRKSAGKPQKKNRHKQEKTAGRKRKTTKK